NLVSVRLMIQTVPGFRPCITNSVSIEISLLRMRWPKRMILFASKRNGKGSAETVIANLI
ncbi:MAG: hypothetical protein KGI92_00350, partial [Alphaproteobacteria bacterium]|nr:hypothetical protein [Alphaproteobacteria bacterium]